MKMEKVQLGKGNASPSDSPTYKPPFNIGDEVEVTREQAGYSGARYEAVVVEPLKPVAPTHYPKNDSKRRGFWVEYKHLLADGGESVPKKEFVRKKCLIRPVPPVATKDESRGFQVNDVVDAFHLAGWWTGVVVGIVWDDGGENGCRYRVGFTEPEEEIEFSELDLRYHLEWVDGNWVRADKIPLQLVTSSAALNHMITGTASSKKKLEVDSRTDDVRPPKKLRSRKHIVEALENQESPSGSGKTRTRKSRLLDLVENKVCFENMVDGEILAPCVHDLKRNGDKDGKLSDSKFQIVEGNRERSFVDLLENRSLAVTQGEETQVLENTLHDLVRAELYSSKTNGISTSAGGSAAAVQPRAGTTTQQLNEMPNAELSSATTPEPEPRLVLPFKKNSALWKELESMEVFTKIPQNPHFSPLAQYDENKREEVALLKITKYVILVERIPKLTVAELNSSAIISDMLDTIKDLEEYGFDLIQIKGHLNDLLLKNEKQTYLRSKLEEEDDKIRKCYLERAVAANEITKIAMKIKDLQKELMSAKTTIETMDSHIKLSGSAKGAICDEIRHVELDFEATVASVKQIFS
ncbi:domain-containing protein 7 [Capsicum galapagoense]